MLRVTGGAHKGRRLAPLPRGSPARPVPARVREAVASSLAPKIPGARILDLFAGSGIVTFELLSRGAASSVLVERDAALVARLHREVRRLGLAECATVVRAGVEDFLARPTGRSFDLVFVDPPYRDAACLMQVCTRLATARILARGAVVVSHRPVVRGRADPLELPSGWEVVRSRRYGQALFEFFTMPHEPTST
ncbi:MAG: 16S rRNA (guanine(966)-N(2))-methyltransferase RsmD [Deltaproteobacteria bacterium]|nr:MAG: 16S rRNA (guanine(966)-N(2))-methyltransferase RsmD [Deltaproteobacteria bacterium]